MLHEEPHRRYADIATLIRDLDHALNGEPLETQPEPLARMVRRLARRHGARLAGAAVLLSALIVAWTGGS